MPGFDGTGPQGFGPRTGRGLGPCGSGFGRGFGRGYKSAQPITLTEDEQKKFLEAEKEQLELELKQLKKRLEELK